MTKKSQITQKDFNSLLNWFSSNADEAALFYEQVRKGLIRFYRFRGCLEAETLTDETFNRVAKKIATIEFDEDFNKSAYFYSFASRIFREDYAKRKKQTAKNEELKVVTMQRLVKLENKKNPSLECLEQCLAKESPETSDVLLEYYNAVKGEKSQLRKKLAEEQNINVQTLHTRVSRMKAGLRDCIKNCLTQERL